MAKIEVKVIRSEWENTYGYRSFDIVDALPAIGDILWGSKVVGITPVTLCSESCGDDKIARYDFFEVSVICNHGDENSAFESAEHIAVEQAYYTISDYIDSANLDIASFSSCSAIRAALAAALPHIPAQDIHDTVYSLYAEWEAWMDEDELPIND